jgi:hypothetical protein
MVAITKCTFEHRKRAFYKIVVVLLEEVHNLEIFFDPNHSLRQLMFFDEDPKRPDHQTEQDILFFFEDYKRGLDYFNSFAIADHFYYPSTLISKTTTTIFSEPDDATQNFDRVLQRHQELGYSGSKIQSHKIRAINKKMCTANIVWRFFKGENQKLFDLEATYILRHNEREWKIASVIAH